MHTNRNVKILCFYVSLIVNYFLIGSSDFLELFCHHTVVVCYLLLLPQ